MKRFSFSVLILIMVFGCSQKQPDSTNALYVQELARADSLQKCLDSLKTWITWKADSTTVKTIADTTQPLSKVASDTSKSSDAPVSSASSTLSIDDQETQWKKLRNEDNDELSGTKIKWSVRIVAIPPGEDEAPWAEINDPWPNEYVCELYDEQGLFGASSVEGRTEGFPVIRENDALNIEGKFEGVTQDGHLAIYCSKITRIKQ